MKRLSALVLTPLALTTLALAGVGCGSNDHGDEMAATPGDESVEAGFARDMSVHHAQAVDMAEAIRRRTTDADLALLATDIALGQQSQIGRMSGWLDEWGLGIGSTNESMAWMDGTSNGHDEHGDGTAGSAEAGSGPVSMPGMASRRQVTALSNLPIDEAELSFLQLMIAHHEGGLEMAEAALALTEHPSVVRLATSIVTSQRAEITVMTDMLADRGVTS